MADEFTTSSPKNEKFKYGKKGLCRLIGIIVLVIIVVVIVYWAVSCLIYPSVSGYQAVFLSNGQVYFGHVSKLNRDYVALKDIYYLQLQKPLQTQEPPVTGGTANQGTLTLIKLGNELHGPKDAMIINQKQILFIENIKDDSKVVQAINQYQTQKANPAASQQPAVNTNTPAETPVK